MGQFLDATDFAGNVLLAYVGLTAPSITSSRVVAVRRSDLRRGPGSCPRSAATSASESEEGQTQCQ